MSGQEKEHDVLRQFAASLALAVLLVASGCTALISDERGADDAPVAEDAEAMTVRMIQINDLYLQSDEFRQEELLSQLVVVAKRRQELLMDLARVAPEQVVRLALPLLLRQAMPADVQTFLEREIDVGGTLSVECGLSLKNSEEEGPVGSPVQSCEHFFNAAEGQYRLYFSKQAPYLESETEVLLSGLGIGDVIVLANDGADGHDHQHLTVLETHNALSKLGEQNVVVLMYNYQDDTSEPVTVAEMENQFRLASDWFEEVSYGQTTMRADVSQWITVPYTREEFRDVSDTRGVIAQLALEQQGIDIADYPRRAYYGTGGPGTGLDYGGYSGLGSVGGNPSYIKMTGRPAVGLIVHEIGHNFTLRHSNSIDCEPGVVLGADCQQIEYGDYWDVMGRSSNETHYNAYQKQRISWLGTAESAAVLEVSSSGTYEIGVMASANSGSPKALRVLKETDPDTAAQTWYYIEFRRGINADSAIAANPLGLSNVENGIIVHTGNDGGVSNSSYLLDMTPDELGPKSDFADPALVVGESYVDAVAGVTFTTLSANASGATVRVDFSSQPPEPCQISAPTITLAPQAQSGDAGETLQFSVTVTNQDSTSCPVAAISAVVNAPSGWSHVLGASTMNLGPGQSDSTFLDLTSAGAAAAASYQFEVRASHGADGDLVTSATAQYDVTAAPPTCIRANPQLTLSPPTQIADAGASVGYVISVANADSEACAPSSFQLSGAVPAGWVNSFENARLSLAPGQTSSTTFFVTSPSTAAAGDFSVAVTADNEAAAGFGSSASGTYTVNPPPPCVRANPSIAVAPATQWAAAGSTARYAVTVTNRDSETCETTGFDLQVAVPALWAASLTPSVVLAPGKSQNLNLDVTSDAQASGGFNNIDVSVTNSVASNYTGTVTATLAINSALDVSVATDRSTYGSRNTVVMTAIVQSGGMPIEGARVEFLVTPPRGRKVTSVVTTDSAGIATTTYQLAKKPKPGDYSVSVEATLAMRVGTASTSFSVSR